MNNAEIRDRSEYLSLAHGPRRRSWEYLHDSSFIVPLFSLALRVLQPSSEELMSSSKLIARYLAENGADVTLKDNKGRTPLDLTQDPDLHEYLEQYRKIEWVRYYPAVAL